MPEYTKARARAMADKLRAKIAPRYLPSVPLSMAPAGPGAAPARPERSEVEKTLRGILGPHGYNALQRAVSLGGILGEFSDAADIRDLGEGAYGMATGGGMQSGIMAAGGLMGVLGGPLPSPTRAMRRLTYDAKIRDVATMERNKSMAAWKELEAARVPKDAPVRTHDFSPRPGESPEEIQQQLAHHAAQSDRVYQVAKAKRDADMRAWEAATGERAGTYPGLDPGQQTPYDAGVRPTGAPFRGLAEDPEPMRRFTSPLPQRPLRYKREPGGEWRRPGLPDVYHGSPHDFPPAPGNVHGRFDFSRIGTGEGAQMYGHGLYFADVDDVSKTYKEMWSGRRIPGAPSGSSKYTVKGQEVPAGMAGHAALDTAQDIDGILAYRYMQAHPQFGMEGYDPSGSVEYLEESIERRIARHRDSPRMGGIAHDDMDALANFYEKHVKGLDPVDVAERPSGRLYKVDIDVDPASLLDWDKPLSEQSEGVRKALRDMGVDVDPARRQRIEAITAEKEALAADRLPNNRMRDERRWHDLSYEQEKLIRAETQSGSGESFYRSLGEGDPVAASAALREAGIPGIRYHDQMSRNIGAGGQANDVAIRLLKAGGGDYDKAIRIARQRMDEAARLPAELRATDTTLSDALDVLERRGIEEGTSNYVIFSDEPITIREKHSALAGGQTFA